MIHKLAYSVQTTFDISPEEKQTAKKAEECFEHLLGLVESAKKHFNIIYEPFKQNQNVSVEETINNRVKLREYRDQIIDNFNQVKACALNCYQLMDVFSNDTTTYDLMDSFTNQMNDIESQVNILIKIFSNLQSEDFSKNIISSIDAVRKECAQLTQLIKDRIIEHIDKNILNKTWVSETSNELKQEIHNKVPDVTKLFQERQKAIESATGVK
jgi:hypothetical protein